MKTTVVLRDDVYQMLIMNFGKRNISNTINEVLVKYLMKKDEKDLFGADKWLIKTGWKDLRNKHDRDI